MDRLSPLDASFLHIEDGVSHMHIASCAIFEGPPPLYEDLARAFAGKLPLVPRYRQKVRFVPGALGRPVWVDDPHFNIGFHLRHTALPAPGSTDELRALMGRLMSQELDRHRPLWEAWMVEGMEGGHWALISKVHHCMVDGVSGTDLMALILDDRPDAVPLDPDDWQPGREPTDAELIADALGDLSRSPYELLRRVRASTRAPRRLAASVQETVEGLRSLGPRLVVPNEQLSIEGTIGPHRRWAFARASLDDVKLVRGAFGGTVNDVVLTVITKGFRDLLEARDEVRDGLVVRTLVPVSVRTKGDHTLNNQVSSIIAELPVGIVDPLERLQSVKEQMVRLKGSHQADAGAQLMALADFAPAGLEAFTLRSASTVMRRLPQRSVNTVTTNVPGPPHTLYASGRRMLEYLPFVPLAHGVRIGVAILSYDGKLGFGVTGDWDTAPDIDLLATGIEDALAELVKLASDQAGH